MLPTDGRRRAKFSGLLTLQRRLRHLKSIMARNVDVNVTKSENVRLFFTLHSAPSSNAFYTSEPVDNNTNPNWATFTPSQFSKNVNLASPSVVVMLWISTGAFERAFCEWTAHFSGLVFIGEKTPNRGYEFASNTVLFGMPEGYYTSSDSVVVLRSRSSPVPTKTLVVPKNKAEGSKDAAKRAAVHNYVKRSYTVCNLQRIHTVRRAMLQTELSVQRLQALICRNLDRESCLESKKRTRESLLLQINLLSDELRYQRVSCEEDKNAIQKLRASLHDRSGRELADKVQALRNGREDLVERRRSLINMKEETLKISSHLMTRRKQLISGLAFIYPIQEVPGKGFTICGVRLPNSEDFAGHDEITIAVALGSVCHYITMISQFLHIPLRYPVRHDGSKSKIVDHILEKLPDSEREFPLYSKGKDKLQFNYGVYLLNKNIAQIKPHFVMEVHKFSQLRFYCGITTHDLRATLPNLHSLLELRLGIKLDPIYAHLAKPVPPNEYATAANFEAPVQGSDEGTDTGKANCVDTQSLDSLTLLRQSDSTCHVTASDDLTALQHDDQYVNLSCSLDQGLNNIERYQLQQHADGKGHPLLPGLKRAYYKLEQLHHGQSGSEPVLLSYRDFEETAEEAKPESSVCWLVGDGTSTAHGDMPNLSSLQHYCECDAILASGLCPCCGSGPVKDEAS